jgi:hypothetical protein
MRESEEDERAEKQLTAADRPQVSQLSDAALEEELRRRAGASAEH